MVMYVGLFGHSAVVFHVVMFFFVFLCFTDCFCGCVLVVQASLFNKLTHLLTDRQLHGAAVTRPRKTIPIGVFRDNDRRRKQKTALA